MVNDKQQNDCQCSDCYHYSGDAPTDGGRVLTAEAAKSIVAHLTPFLGNDVAGASDYIAARIEQLTSTLRAENERLHRRIVNAAALYRKRCPESYTDLDDCDLLDAIARSAGSFGALAAKANQRAETAERERDIKESTIMSVVYTAGGLVEGMPTSRVNFLQRIRALVEAERERDAANELLKAATDANNDMQNEMGRMADREYTANEKLAAAQAAAIELNSVLENSRELNMCNYDHDQVADLNASMVEACLLSRKVLSSDRSALDAHTKAAVEEATKELREKLATAHAAKTNAEEQELKAAQELDRANARIAELESRDSYCEKLRANLRQAGAEKGGGK